MNNFELWNKLKIELDSKENIKRFPKVSEVWLIILGKNIGFEQNGKGRDFSRPVVIIKKFNNNMYLVLPLSSVQKEISFYLNFTDANGRAVSVILSQIRLVSIKRFKRKIYTMPIDTFEAIIGKIKQWF